MSADNKSLGTFILDGIPPAPRGVPQVEVTFDMDAAGILTVTAKDKATGKTQNITITGAVGLSDDEVKRMQEEAEKHKEEDEKKAETIEAKNNADAMVATAEKALKDAGDKVVQRCKEKVEEKIKKVKEVTAKEGSSKEDIEVRHKRFIGYLEPNRPSDVRQAKSTTQLLKVQMKRKRKKRKGKIKRKTKRGKS